MATERQIFFILDVRLQVTSKDFLDFLFSPFSRKIKYICKYVIQI